MTSESSPLYLFESRIIEEVYVIRDPKGLDDLPADLREIASMFNGERTVGDICDEVHISMTHALRLIDKLAQHVDLVEVRHLAPQEVLQLIEHEQEDRDFTLLEESFFDSEVTPIDECDLPFEKTADRVEHVLYNWKLRITDSFMPVEVRNDKN